MGENIKAIHSLHIGGLYQLPHPFKNLAVGLELGAGIYAYEKINQTFKFGPNSSNVVPVNYTSSVFNANLQTRYQLGDETRNMIVPYLHVKAGLYNFHSNVYVEDPDDPDGCHPLDKKNLISDNTLFWGAGAGFQINPSVFSKHKKHGPVMIDLSINTIRGGKLDYINTKHMKDEEEISETDGKALTVRFLKASTQNIYEHKVAQVYTSALRILEIKAGVIVKLEKEKWK
jgi:hypothetical protein